MGTQVRRIIFSEPISNTWQESTSEMEVGKTLEHRETPVFLVVSHKENQIRKKSANKLSQVCLPTRQPVT